MITVSIVSYNNGRKIIPTLDSLRQWAPADKLERVWLVDNCSTDDTVDILTDYCSRHPIFELTCNSINRGFGRAHNQVMLTTGCRYHIICNPDIVLDSDAISPMAAYMDQHTDIGILCPRYRFPTGELQPLNRLNPTLTDLFLRRFLPSPLRPFFKRRLDAYEMRDVGYEHSYEVPFVSGAFMFCRSKTLRTVGGFDDRFFLYFEDADLSRKVQKQGHRTVFFPAVEVVHGWERLAHKNLRITLIFVKSAIQFFNKWGYAIT